MNRINLNAFSLDDTYDRHLKLAEALNGVMDYLEENLPKKNGKFYKCLNCGHTTGYRNDLDECCENPVYVEVL